MALSVEKLAVKSMRVKRIEITDEAVVVALTKYAGPLSWWGRGFGAKGLLVGLCNSWRW